MTHPRIDVARGDLDTRPQRPLQRESAGLQVLRSRVPREEAVWRRDRLERGEEAEYRGHRQGQQRRAAIHPPAILLAGRTCTVRAPSTVSWPAASGARITILGRRCGSTTAAKHGRWTLQAAA